MQSVVAFFGRRLNLNTSNQINVLGMDKQQFDNCLVVMDYSNPVDVEPYRPTLVGLYRSTRFMDEGGTHVAKL
jgi:hypothetical protein